MGAVAALAAVLWTALRVVPSEFRKFRLQKAIEVRADVAREVWVAAEALVRGIEAVCNPFSIGAPEPPAEDSAGTRFRRIWAPKMRELVGDLSADFIKAMSMADLYFPKGPLHAALEEAWKTKADVWVQMEAYAHDLDVPGTAPDAWKKLFGPERRTQLEDLKKQLQEAIRPYALPDATQEDGPRNRRISAEGHAITPVEPPVK